MKEVVIQSSDLIKALNILKQIFQRDTLRGEFLKRNKRAWSLFPQKQHF